MRPKELSDCLTSTAKSLAHHFSAGEINCEDRSIIILQPTTPFTTSIEIDSAIQISKKNYAHSIKHGLVSVRLVPDKFSAYWQFSTRDNENNTLSQLYDEEKPLTSRRQDLPKTFYRSGSVYITSPGLLMADKILGEKPLALCVDRMGYHVNIDSLDDWRQASDYVRNFRFIS